MKKTLLFILITLLTPFFASTMEEVDPSLFDPEENPFIFESFTQQFFIRKMIEEYLPEQENLLDLDLVYEYILSKMETDPEQCIRRINKVLDRYPGLLEEDAFRAFQNSPTELITTLVPQIATNRIFQKALREELIKILNPEFLELFALETQIFNLLSELQTYELSAKKLSEIASTILKGFSWEPQLNPEQMVTIFSLHSNLLQIPEFQTLLNDISKAIRDLDSYFDQFIIEHNINTTQHIAVKALIYQRLGIEDLKQLVSLFVTSALENIEIEELMVENIEFFLRMSHFINNTIRSYIQLDEIINNICLKTLGLILPKAKILIYENLPQKSTKMWFKTLDEKYLSQIHDSIEENIVPVLFTLCQEYI